MNCEKGDLAVVVRECYVEREPSGERVITVRPGKIVKCAETGSCDGVFCWILEEPIPIKARFSDGEGVGDVFAIDDNYLRPLRHPGKDATDEMVKRCGKPGVTAVAIDTSLGQTWHYDRFNGWRQM